MARRLFGSRKREDFITADWPQAPGDLLPMASAAPTRIPPPPPPMPDRSKAQPDPAGSEADLLERIAGFRSAVADSLYEVSKDYQMLCNLRHADVPACEEIVAELRRRLSGNVHYEVLAKLDEAHALVAARVEDK
jgi:hypothetical protein